MGTGARGVGCGVDAELISIGSNPFRAGGTDKFKDGCSFLNCSLTAKGNWGADSRSRAASSLMRESSLSASILSERGSDNSRVIRLWSLAYWIDAFLWLAALEAKAK